METTDNQDFDADMFDNIREVNLSYLMVAQHLLRQNLARGMFRLGLDEDAASILLKLSPAQVVKIASTGSLICAFRLNDASLLHALRLDDRGLPPARAAANMHHISILLAQQAARGTITHDRNAVPA